MSRRPSTATVIACLALFVSLGGAGYAASGSTAPSFYTVQSAAKTLTASSPSVRVSINCARGDQAVSGGYTGTDELVTLDSVTGGTQRLSGWTVAAHLAPGDRSGEVSAEVVCSR